LDNYHWGANFTGRPNSVFRDNLCTPISSIMLMFSKLRK
jgi:hypothetical protein